MDRSAKPSNRARRWRLVRWAIAALLLVAFTALLASWLALRGSLPALDGPRRLAGLGVEVRIERDANGVPTIHAASREDAARALGFLHAQDRFFQMDLLRRQSAGELAELFGPAAEPLDAEMRLHRFRHRAEGTLTRFAPDELRLLDAYAAGVNSGLSALSTRPWEYLVLRAQPRLWTRADTVLVVQTMTVALQAHDGVDERARQAIKDVYGDQVLAFLRPPLTAASAALDNSSAPAPPVPDAATLSLRQKSASSATENDHPTGPFPPSPICGNLRNLRTTQTRAANPETLPSAWFLPPHDLDAVPGSNSFALAGSRVAGGGALVANDMHLGLAVPNTWYRASLALPGRTATGVTLPGVPGIVAGSNGDIAWGFTDAYADTCDVVIVERDPANPAHYRVPDGDGWETFETAQETIQVARGQAKTITVTSTRWGPLIASGDAASGGQTLALRWSAHEPDARNLRLARMMDARTVDEAIDLAHDCGVPAQNFVVGDRAGNVAWTIIGRVPKRIGFDGSLPESWADGARRWDGFLSPQEIPTIRNPPDGQLWTANNRTLGGEGLALLGNGGYDLPARAAQIRDRLAALSGRAATPADALAIQLDDESLFLARWRNLLRSVLTDEIIRSNPSLSELRQVIDAWHGHAVPGEAGHRLVRDFRQRVMEMVLNPIYEPVRLRAPFLNLSSTHFKDAEQPLWTILAERPAHLLPSRYQSWDDLLRAAAVATANPNSNGQTPRPLKTLVWGEVNTLEMRHPFSRLLPSWLAAALNMPETPLPGDSNMPRVQGPSFGASERMDVSPGREREGIFHQPGGASGHPLSPFYRAGHEAWVQGRATPFLPGPSKHQLTLQP